MKLRKIALATSLMLSSTVTLAGVSGNIGIASDYFWRGVTQGNHNATVSGGLDYSHDIGVYVGTWVANLEGGTEVDLYGGFSGEVSGFGYDIGYIKYHYPFAADFDEAYVGASFMGADLYYYYDLENENGYVSLAYSREIKKDLSLGATVGSYMFDDSASDYNHISVALGTKMGEWDASFALNVTDIDDDKPVPFVSISRGFDL